MLHDVIIRPGTAADLAAIAAIQRSSFGAAQWDARDYLSYVVWIAEVESEVVGFLVARSLTSDEHEILNIAISPRWQRRGIGTALLHRALEQFPGTYFLEVRKNNTDARAFYARAGFHEVGIRRNYYSEPLDDAVVMRIGS